MPSLGLPTGSSGKVTTAGDGRFTIKGESGSSISFGGLELRGYHNADSMTRSFGYGSNAEPHQPDRSNPVIFVMTKDGSSKSLEKENQFEIRLGWNG
jgi:hypothetical protein